MSQAPVKRPRGSRDLTPNHKYLYRLVRQSGLTFPSVSRLVADLLELGLLKEGVHRRGGMGKPALELDVNPDHGFSLGIFLDGDTATGKLINVLGETLKETDFSSVSLTDGIENALAESNLDLKKLIGVCFTTPSECLVKDERERPVAKWGVPVFALPTIAASVRAERYFGSASELARFVYFDATSLELGAVVNGTVLAQPGTLAKLLGVRQGKKDCCPRLSKVLRPYCRLKL